MNVLKLDSHDKLDLLINKLESFMLSIAELKNENKILQDKLIFIDDRLNQLQSSLSKEFKNLNENLEPIKKDTLRMNHHINLVENGINYARSLSPFQFLKTIIPFKEIQNSNKELLEREIENNDLKYVSSSEDDYED